MASVLARIGTWRVDGYSALNNAATVASALAAGYVTAGASGRYELTDLGAEWLRTMEGGV
jgi:hypothetical protein